MIDAASDHLICGDVKPTEKPDMLPVDDMVSSPRWSVEPVQDVKPANEAD